MDATAHVRNNQARAPDDLARATVWGVWDDVKRLTLPCSVCDEAHDYDGFIRSHFGSAPVAFGAIVLRRRRQDQTYQQWRAEKVPKRKPNRATRSIDNIRTRPNPWAA